MRILYMARVSDNEVSVCISNPCEPEHRLQTAPNDLFQSFFLFLALNDVIKVANYNIFILGIALAVSTPAVQNFCLHRGDIHKKVCLKS